MPLDEILSACLDQAIQTAFRSFLLHFCPKVSALLPPLHFQEYLDTNLVHLQTYQKKICVVNKPYDMYINSDDENVKNTVACHIGCHDSHQATSSKPLHFVQRLDYSTSGVLCVAKNRAAAASAGKQFERRETSKYYLAVLRGLVPFQLADIHYDIGADMTPMNGHKMAAVIDSSGHCGQPRAAHTRVLVMETGFYEDDPATLVMMKPITGRRHQLRVHCYAMGHTIVGDYTYSDREDTTPHRMFLHAARLVLPVKEEPLDVRCSEAFTSDAQFCRSWRRSTHLYDFDAACDALDSTNADGLDYRIYQKT